MKKKPFGQELDFVSSVPKDKIDRAETTVVARNPDGSSLSTII